MIYFFYLKRSGGRITNIHRRPQQKHYSFKFNFKYSKTETEFLDAKIFKETNGKLCLTSYCKPTDWQNYSHFKSDNPSPLKKNFPCSQAPHLSNICTEINEVTKHLAKLNEAF